MNRKLAETVKRLHLFKLGNPYQNRKVAQATIYILQQMGVKFGYDDYNMKVVGIHSCKLSQDLTEMFPVATLGKEAAEKQKVKR